MEQQIIRLTIMVMSVCCGVGCPWNNQIFFWVQTKTQSVSIVLGLFCETKNHFFWFVSVFRTGINTTETNRISSKQTEKSSINILYWGVLKTVNFFSQFEPKQTKTQSVSVVFQFAFSRNQKFFVWVCFDVLDQYRNNRNKQNLWYGELKRLIF